MKPILFLTIAVAHAAWAGPVYQVTDLGTLGGNTSMAYALNDSGHTVGTATDMFGNMDAVSFGVRLPVSAGASDSSAWGVNNANEISGTQYIAGQAYATIWGATGSNNGMPQTIAGAGSYGMGINQNGDVAGMLTTSGGQGEAFITQNGVLRPLGTLAGSTWSAAYGINSSDQAVGYTQSGGVMNAFIWSAQTGYVMLGTLGGRNSYAMAINDSGEVAGHAQIGTGYLHAVVWNNGSIQDLGTLSGGNSYAYGLDNAGDVVGASGSHAFLYQNGVMLDLNNLIGSSSGWTLTQAYAINSQGEIAGAGLFDGVEHAFLLDPVQPPSSLSSSSASFSALAPQSQVVTPEPATWALVLLGLVGQAIVFRRLSS